MIKSMTGYGISVLENELIRVTVEVKSLNSKFLDLGFRLPKEFSDKEFEARNLISSILERGKISVMVDIQEKGQAKPSVTINRGLVKQYYQDLVETCKELGTDSADLFRIALTMPNAMNSDSENSDTSENWKVVFEALKKSFEKCDEFRIQEGNGLQVKLGEYIQQIGLALGKIESFDPQRIAAIRERIKNHFEEYKQTENLDSNRFEQELIFYIEKLDISEEKVRLKSHLNYFMETMSLPDANGKKLGFIAQEIGREINTIGSKANDANIQRHVVNMKEELEKIKEQSLNIL
jgi:uncharacterized protein (TIGR00255 family)